MKGIHMTNLDEWASRATQILARNRGNEEEQYEVVVTIKPNPPEMKGLDECQISIWRHTSYSSGDGRGLKHERLWARGSSRHTTVEACVRELNEQLDTILSKTNEPDVIELGGKKFRLVEVK